MRPTPKRPSRKVMILSTTTACGSAAFKVQVAVIGAGVIGLAVAKALAEKGKEVLIIDRASKIGSETSSRNSEVIHAGLYYPPSSYKAQFCVRGKELLYRYCHAKDIPFVNCGKLIVATNPEQLHANIPILQEQANQSGVLDTRILTQQDVQVLEPQVSCHGALWSPSTGVLDSHSYLQCLLADAEKDGRATLALQSKVDQIAVMNHNANMLLQVVEGSSESSSNNNSSHDKYESCWLECQTVINCAGLWAHQIAAATVAPKTRTTTATSTPQYFAKGTYFRLQSSSSPPPFTHLVYPIPEPGGLGVHATVDWMGQSVKFGPDVEWMDPAHPDPDRIDLVPDPSRADKFYQEIRKYWPYLPDHSLVPDYAGVRPKLQHPDVVSQLAFQDFQIQGPEQSGIQGLYQMFGMESPGLTSSLAIGEYMANRIQ